MSETGYTFDGPDDARMYLREVSILWVVWIVALIGLMMTNAVLLVVWAVVVLVALVLLARPLQRRAERMAPEYKVEGGKLNTALRGGTNRDRILRELFYGTGPLIAALETAAMSRRWVAIRHLVVVLTIAALLYVIFSPMS